MISSCKSLSMFLIIYQPISSRSSSFFWTKHLFLIYFSRTAIHFLICMPLFFLCSIITTSDVMPSYSFCCSFPFPMRSLKAFKYQFFCSEVIFVIPFRNCEIGMLWWFATKNSQTKIYHLEKPAVMGFF